jgi:hypothetical protein
MGKPIFWDHAKSKQLRHQYGIGFEEVIIALEQEKLLDDRKHPNTQQYGHQRQLVLQIDDYVYVVPYINDTNHYFLKTLFPSRRATQEYLTNSESS